MRTCRISGFMLVLALSAGCAQEKKAESPTPSKPGQQTANADSPKEESKPLSPDELLAQAKEALSKDDAAAAIVALQKILAQDPKNRDALFLLTQVLQVKGILAIQKGDKAVAAYTLKESAKYMRQLQSAYPKLTSDEAQQLPGILFNEVRILAQEKKTDAAMAALEDAFKAGYANLESLNIDRDLDNLRSLPAFQEFMKKAEAKMAVLAKESARRAIAAQTPFEFNFSLPDVDGKVISKKDFAGKVLVADIWGTWCPPCRQEIPNFVQLQKKLESRGLQIVGINYENGDAAQVKKAIQDFAWSNKMNYPCVLGDEKTRTQVPNFQGYPTTIFMDRTGKVRLAAVGYHSLPDLEAVILELMDDKTASLK